MKIFRFMVNVEGTVSVPDKAGKFEISGGCQIRTQMVQIPLIENQRSKMIMKAAHD